MTATFPLVIGTDLGLTDYNAIVPVSFVNPANNQSMDVHVQLDTGAFITLAPLSLATILGLQVQLGTPISLTGVGGAMTQAYVHTVNLTIGNDVYQGLTVAIAVDESIPFLLGRVNFWDMSSIQIDNIARTVTLTPIPYTAPPTGTGGGGGTPQALYGNPLAAIGVYTLVLAPLYFTREFKELLEEIGLHY